MSQVNGGGLFFGPWGFETPEPIHLKCGMCDYVHSPTPNAKYDGWVGINVKMYRRVLFRFCLVPSTRPHLTLRSADFRTVHP